MKIYFSGSWCWTWPPPAHHCSPGACRPVVWNGKLSRDLLAPFSHPLPNSSVRPPFFLSHFEQSQAALRGSDAVHLGWSLTCSAEKRAFGRGHMKTTYALNPQQNPGVRYNGENHFGGKRLERQQSCGNVSETTARPLHFLLVSFSSLGRNCPAGKSNHL